ncbi:MAG: ABC transporter substrate-binding protein [Synergistes jonesii]|uniref:ABC transporter substrate-binding protein n=1 Tax=Synergistes jonesii TaxID=2754 RepID=UPI002A750BA7|nr:ABC transporter substrate-binding protein [Synergistes jonesii]MDY2984871.1 ABC transporter substrate-binding protein [Synergistes jonesii]
MKRYFSYFVLALLVALTCVQAVDAAIQAGPIKIGVVMPTTGPIAYDGRLTLNGIEMAVEEINKAGGIKGNKVELFIEDSANVPATAVAAMEKLVGMQKVTGVIGDFGSSCTLAMMDVAQRSHTPLITPISLAPKITEMNNKWMFRGCDNSAMIAKAFTKWAVNDKKAKKWAYIAINTDYGRGSVEAFNVELEKLGGKAVFTEYFNQGETDYYPIVTKLRASGADALCMFGETVDLSRVVAQFYEMGLGGKMLLMDPTSGTFNEKFIELAKKNSNGIVGASRFVASIPTPAAKKFTSDYKTRYKIDPEKYAQAGYDCMKMIALAVRNADSTDRAKVRDALAAIKYEGPQGKAHFDAKNQLQISEYIVMVEDGKIVVVAGPISGE